MDYCHKLYTLLYLSRKVKNTAAIYSDIEETIKKVPTFTGLRHDCLQGMTHCCPLIFAIEYGCSEEIMDLLKKHYHNENNMYYGRHGCSLCDAHEEMFDIKGDMKVMINNEYYIESKYINNLAKIFNVKLINNRKKRHAYILKHKISEDSSDT
jgi:hypothetical protein